MSKSFQGYIFSYWPQSYLSSFQVNRRFLDWTGQEHCRFLRESRFCLQNWWFWLRQPPRLVEMLMMNERLLGFILGFEQDHPKWFRPVFSPRRNVLNFCRSLSLPNGYLFFYWFIHPRSSTRTNSYQRPKSLFYNFYLHRYLAHHSCF